MRHLRVIAEFPLTKPQGARTRVGELPVAALTPRAVDRLYMRLVAGGVQRLSTDRVRQAAFEINIMKIAWRSVQRIYPTWFPAGNPFEGMTREERGTQTKTPATAAEAYALADALKAAGHPHLGAAALICFEWLQRPENVLSGAMTWSDYRPGASVRIQHWETDKVINLALADADGPLYPEFEAWLADLPRLGVPIVLNCVGPGGRQMPPRLYQARHAHAVVRRARMAAGLPDHLTLAACRHGGITELGDAEVTETEGMALSAHSTPSVFHRYAKKTATQRLHGARKRRVWREQGGD